MNVPPITRAKTCQNCQFGKFDQRNSFVGGKKINGLCMKYADAPMPKEPINIRDVFRYLNVHPDYELAITMFKDIRILDGLPTWDTFYRYYLAIVPNVWQQSKATVHGWYVGIYTWSAWWIRNWTAVAERKIDRTTVCEVWDGTQTSKFYRPKKQRNGRQSHSN